MRALLVTDIRIYREGLAVLLAERQEIDGIVTASCMVEAMAQLASQQVDVVLLDVSMTEEVESLEAMRKAYPDVDVVGLGVAADEQEILKFAEKGIRGFVFANASVDQLVTTLGATANGELHCKPRTVAAMARRIEILAGFRTAGADDVTLTPRQLEIARLIENGLSNKEIAIRLSIEVATVKNHVHNLLEKLNVHHRGEAAARLRQHRCAAIPTDARVIR